MKIIAISDLHGQLDFTIPECDLLVVGGDVCPDKIYGEYAINFPDWQLQWFENTFIPWVEDQPAEFVAITWGNHDWCGHLKPNAEYGKKTSVISDGPVIVNGTKFWLTPWSNQFMTWAWMQEHDKLAEVYAKIPEDVDVIVSHQPPYGFGDLYPNMHTGKLEHVGSSELLYTIERVKPEVVICGHLHGGHGMYKHQETHIYNVSMLNDTYQKVFEPTIIEI